MKPFLIFALCLSLALPGISLPAFSQYGKATEQNTPTMAPKQKSKDKNDGVRHYTGPKKAEEPTKTKTQPSPASSFTIPKNANINVFYDDFSIKKTLGGQIFCQMTFYIENNTKMNLDALALHMKWSGISTNINVTSIPADDLKPVRYALAGKGCYTMGDIPKLTVNKCAMRSFTADGRVIDIPEDQCKNIVIFK